ncbi:unnamed protein product [Effrenium voratum]|uniref:ATP synthase subunit b n=1 Tax=Effrenium voratum TaxID=2562239 RepID=A0AA36JC54_9DINO|nr:unnamed protein product [Effrenium voratum]CAJ1413738.1 unnamed protein product [Effrenium voratum]
MAMARRSPLVLVLLALCGPAFLMPSTQQSAPEKTQQLMTAGGAIMVASLPAPAYAGGMFDFGLTLPFVAITFLTMMAVLNALWFAPVTEEMDERNAKLLQTLSEATDMLAKADEMQVEYTANIKEAREKAAKELAAARKSTEEAIARDAAVAESEREKKASAFRAKLEAEIQEKMNGAENVIKERQADFVKTSLQAVGL